MDRQSEWRFCVPVLARGPGPALSHEPYKKFGTVKRHVEMSGGPGYKRLLANLLKELDGIRAADWRNDPARLEAEHDWLMRAVERLNITLAGTSMAGIPTELIERIAKIVDPEAFGLPDNVEATSLSDRDQARDRARLILMELYD